MSTPIESTEAGGQEISKRQAKKMAKNQARQNKKAEKQAEKQAEAKTNPKPEGQEKKQDQPKKQQQQQQPKQNQPKQQNSDKKPQNQKQGQKPSQPQQQQKQGQKVAPKQEKPQPAEEEQISEINKLFSHILVVEKCSSQRLIEISAEKSKEPLHPALIEYILSTCFDVSLDENEKCRRFMKAMRSMIEDEPISETERFMYSIYRITKVTMTLLNKIRMTTPGIGNCVRFIKAQLPKDGATQSVAADEEFRAAIFAAIDNFVREKIDDVASLLVRNVSNSIVDGDVILTYGYSPVICEALLEASKTHNFRVVVVDSRPTFNSKVVIEKLHDLDVRYVLISGLSYVMPEVTKVLIEPCGILSNNAALTPVGTAMVAMVAHEFGVPVIFVCGSYRFVGDVRVDALAKNEILGPDFVDSMQVPGAVKDKEYFALMYDVTPGEYVNVVISEIGENPVNSISTNMKYIQESYTFFSHTTNALKNKTK